MEGGHHRNKSTMLTSIQHLLNQPLDATLVDNTPRLLEVLNRSERLSKLLNKRDDRGYTLLHMAAERNQPESLKCLLIKEANPNVRSNPVSKEVSPLHIAAGSGHLACLQLLVQLGGDIMARDVEQLTPVDYASVNGQDLCLKYLNDVLAQRLMDEGTEVEQVLIEIERNLVANNTQTLDHWKLFNTLFPLTVPKSGLSQAESLMYRQCVLINNQELVKMLSRLAKDIPHTLHDASLLHAACRYGRLGLVQQLVDKVPAIALRLTSEGYNALHIAVAHKQLEIVKALTQKQVSWAHSRHVRMATSGHEQNLLEDSLGHGVAKFGSATMSGHTAIHLAVAVNDTNILSYLLKHHRELKLSPDANECCYTALHLAVYLNRADAVQLLLRRGANPNTRLNPAQLEKVTISRTPLSEATTNKNLQILSLLLECGAEDKHYDAIRICIPSRHHHELVVPLLGSLVKYDDNYKPTKNSKDRRYKMAMMKWSELQLTELQPHWIAGALSRARFLCSQNIDSSRSMTEFVTCLNLSNNQLKTLPPEVFYLSRLQQLIVSNNELESLPEIQKGWSQTENDYLWPCSCLNRIMLDRNHLVLLPEFIFSLPKLSYLDVSQNHLRKLPFSMWTTPKLHTFICSNNEIEAIPTNWPHIMNECHVITTACASPKSMESSKSPNHEGAKSPEAGDDKNSPVPRYLTTSVEHGDGDGGHKGEGDEAIELTQVSKLQDRLNISNGNLPIEWQSSDSQDEEYEGLALLKLSHNHIAEVPENLPCLCPKLIRLELENNDIKSINFPRSFPSTLKHLNMSHNPLESLDCPHMMAKPLPCTNPGVLQETGFTIHKDEASYCAHRSHLNLLNLTVLEMSHCELEIVNFFGPQTRVRHGRNSRNSQGDNNATVGSPATAATGSNPRPHQGKRPNRSKLVCPLLTRLVLSHNQLEKVPESVCEMTELNTLDLSNNAIISLPADMGKLYKLWEFPLTGLKLICPPHNIIERGKTKDIIGFLWSLLQRARPYHRMKLMLVGYAARGKTTLLQRISEKGQRGVQENWALQRILERSKYNRNNHPNISTVGIVVSDWTYYKKVKQSQTALKSITFMTWDFGGQEEYYATHQCFLSRRSLYLVVWNVSHGMKGAEEIKPWLLNIQARAPHSPVVIVGTHEDKLNSRSRRELELAKDYIDKTYGSEGKRKEGFPQVLHSFVVSCKSGYHIKEVRDRIFDIASQVKESIVAGRGVGCGRIPEHRLLMDQLVPASYLQLEDTVRNISLIMRLQGKPPVLTYKELRDAVFADPRTLISRNALDRELEQAVRFLHDNGTMLHFEDPLLSDLYFVDPQWLCDMLAHVVTVREINPLVRDGVMRIADFPLIFNDKEFPICWEREYIRLLTTFEVAVELGNGELLIPSALHPDKPNLPQTMFPEDLKMLPPLRHCYVVPFIPSGFWPRLISRLLTDPTIIGLAREGCGLTEDDTDQLTWLKWKTGMILQYGNLTLLSVEELNGGMFPKAQHHDGVRIYGEAKWKTHNSDYKIFGINIEVPDIYPILKYPEAKRKSRRSAGYIKVNEQAMPNVPPPVPIIHEPKASLDTIDGELVDPSSTGYLPHVNDNQKQNAIKLSDIDDMIERLRKKRSLRHRPVGLHAGPTLTSLDENSDGESSSHEADDVVTDGVVKTGLAKPTCAIRRARSNERLNQLTGNTVDKQSAAAVNGGRAGQLSPEASSLLSSVTATVASSTPVVDEEKNDIMRAGLLSKVVDHISLLVEDWFVGVRPRTSVIPCPFCSEDISRDLAEFHRSFSDNPVLLSPEERAEKGLQLSNGQQQPTQSPSQAVHTSEAPSAAAINLDPTPSITKSVPSSLGKADLTRSKQYSRQDNVGEMMISERTHTRAKMSPRPARQHSRRYCYAFLHNECIITARAKDIIQCPTHGDILLHYTAPDTLFMTEGHNILVDPTNLIRGESIGKGAFATVYRATMKKMTEEGELEIDVAFKALTKEWRYQDQDPDYQMDESDNPETRSNHSENRSILSRGAGITRRSIIDGFGGVKKELSILSPLKHPHIIQLHGVMMRPLGLILELAPQGSIKTILQNYAEAHAHLHISVIKQVVIQVASALQYLHDNKIIYRDLKSDNVLVWKFPDPQDAPAPVHGTDDVLVKLSDYGISQFVATQGARGLVGTPGFMAPEMLKYQGKEVYTTQIDFFSFAMFIYELITLHVPYDHLNGQQANQANEKGERPSLKRKDFPCPVLLRELMVWCWQENPEDRPKGDEIIEKCNTLHFPKLLDGIRVCDAGQVTATCARVITGYTPAFRRRKSRIISPPVFYPSIGSSTGAATPPILTTVDEEESGVYSSYSNKPTSIHVKSELHEAAYGGTSLRWNGVAGGIKDHRDSASDPTGSKSNVRTSVGDSAYTSRRVTELGTGESVEVSVPVDKDTPRQKTPPVSTPSAEITNQSAAVNRQTTSSTASLTPPLLTPSHQQKFCVEEPRTKYRWSPRMGDQYSPSFSDDEQPTFELWVATSNARHSVATIIDYSGKFTNIEDVEVGDSPVLSMCVVRDKVWMGFEIGYLMMFDTSSKRPHIQFWVKQYKKILSIVHIASLHKVYLGLDDGSVLMYDDELPSGLVSQTPACIKYDPVLDYMDSTQTSSCLLAIPRIESSTSDSNPPAPSAPQSFSEKPPSSFELQPPSIPEHLKAPQSSGPAYELWVGQKGGLITILDAETLDVITFIHNPLDLSRLPSYVAYLSYAHLIYGVNSESVGTAGMVTGSMPDVVSVYGALYHGQYVTKWNTTSKKAEESFNCEKHLEKGEECNITALHYSQLQLYVGLQSGKVLIMNALTFNLLCFLDCHRGTVSSFLSLNLALLQQQVDPNVGDFSLIGSNSETSMFHSSEGPSPLLSMYRRSSSLGSLSPTSHFNQLLSFGNGFKSYYDGAEAQNHFNAGFMLVWESDDWTRTY